MYAVPTSSINGVKSESIYNQSVAVVGQTGSNAKRKQEIECLTRTSLVRGYDGWGCDSFSELQFAESLQFRSDLVIIRAKAR